MNPESENETPGSSSTPSALPRSVGGSSTQTPSASTLLSTPASLSKGKQPANACHECVRAKRKCDGETPCLCCQERGIVCRAYIAPVEPEREPEGVKKIRPPPAQNLLSCDEARQVIGTDPGAAGLFATLDALLGAQSRLQRKEQDAVEPINVNHEKLPEQRITEMLPPRQVCDRLVKFYMMVFEGIYRTLHSPSFLDECERYWAGEETQYSFLPRFLCILCIAARFNTGSRGLGKDRSTTIHIPTACDLVEEWLYSKRVYDETDGYFPLFLDVWILQVELLLFFARRTIGLRQQTVREKIQIITQTALEVNIHQDSIGHIHGHGGVEAERRRRLWHTVMELELNESMACNLPYNSRWPERPELANLDDVKFGSDAETLPPQQPLPRQTDSHLQAYAATTFDNRRQAADLLARSAAVAENGIALYTTEEGKGECRRISRDLQSSLVCVDTFFPLPRPSFSSRLPFPRLFFDGKDGKPIPRRHCEWHRRLQLDLHLRRPLLALCRPYVLSGPEWLVDLEKEFLDSCMKVLGYLDCDDGGDGDGDGGGIVPEPALLSRGDSAVLEMFVLQDPLFEAAFDVCFLLQRARGED